jgi:Big-like domain-containing protein
MKFTIALTIFSLLLLLSVAGSAQTYTVKSLPNSVVTASINNHGHVAGSANLPPGSERVGEAFLWTPTRGMKFLGSLPGTCGQSCYLKLYSGAWGLNDKDQVVGSALVNSDETHQEEHPFFWSQATGMQDLGGAFAIATRINNQGIVLGIGPYGIWTRDRGFTVVPLFFPALLNNEGVVLGLYGSPIQGQTLVTWTRAGGIGPPLNVDPNGNNPLIAYDFNNKGEVVGPSINMGWVFWSPVSGRQSIPPLPGTPACFSGAIAINNLSQVVGGAWGPYIWTAATGTENLNLLIPQNLGLTLCAAFDINDAGQIVVASLANPRPPSGWPYRLHVLSPRMNVSLSSPGPALAGMNFPLRATVTSAQGYVPKDGELVTFKIEGVTTIGKAKLKHGIATEMVALPAGSHSIRAYYAGSENYAASASPSLLQTVQ